MNATCHLLLAAGLAGTLVPASAQADLIITNGKIATMAKEGEFVQAVAVKDGLIVATGSNAQVLELKGVSSFGAWPSVYWAATGKTVGGLQTWQAADVPSRYQALYLMTRGSAWMSNEEKVKGAIKPGQYADLVLLPRDYFTMAIEQGKNLESELTIVNGKVVYAAGDYAALAPQLPAVSPAWSPVKYFGGYQNRAQ